MRRIFVMFLVLAGASWLGCDDGGESGSKSCISHDDCSGTKFCIQGVCKEPGCTSDEECPEGYRCLSTGACKKDVACEVDTDCPPGKSCVDYECVGSTCSPDGQTTVCYIGCHEGKKSCINGDWTACDAAPVLQGEACNNGIDDDCNGEIDEDCVQCSPGDAPLPCSSPCGDGEQVCVGGMWSECSAPTDCVCDEPGAVEEVPCGNCGTMTRTCNQVQGTTLYMWDEYAPCKGEGLCAAGDQEETPCGFQCGVQVRTCGEDCTWSDWSACGDEGMCMPGDTEDKECGNCGIQTKICGEDCFWEPWGSCQEGEGCKLGDSESKPCGNCGTMTRYCEANCAWGDWGSCLNEGVCGPGEKETEPCGYCGVKERTCTNSCTWGSYSSCQEGGECSPGDSKSQSCGPTTSLGICEKGTQTKTCNNACMWNPWGSCLGAVYPKTEICGDGIDQDCDGSDKKQPDQYEPNNSCSSCEWISGDDPVVTLYPTFDTLGGNLGGTDTNDYFCFKGVDNFNVWPSAEHIKVTLKNQPVGVDGDLFLYKGYSNCTSGTHLKSSVTIGGANESIDWEETGGDDTDTYYVRVENWSEKASCSQPYTLEIQGLK